MFDNIAVALDHSPPSARAFQAALELAGRLDRKLFTVTVKEPLPAYTAFAAVADPDAIHTLQEEQDRYYVELTHNAVEKGLAHGVYIRPFILDGDQVESIITFVEEQKIDLLVLGLHRRSLRMSSLWSTVYSLAQDLSCNMLGIH